jgi:hypothetical protein
MLKQNKSTIKSFNQCASKQACPRDKGRRSHLNHLNIKWFRALPKSHIISYFLFLFRNIFHHCKATELSQRESSKHVLLNKHVPGTLLKKNEAL